MSNEYSFTLRSSNRKTGPIPVIGITSNSCPSACPLKGNGCYAAIGLTAIYWRKLNKKGGLKISELASRIKSLPARQLFRYAVYGDLPGEDNKINKKDLNVLVAANKGKKGFSYTHKPVLGAGKLEKSNREAIRKANEEGFTINLSGNNPKNADELFDLGVAPVVTVLPSHQTTNTVTPKGHKIVVCPATKSDRITCSNCQLCQKKDRNFIVGFPAHGSQWKKVDQIAS